MSDGVAEDDLAWTEACRREEAIRTLLLRHPDRLKRQSVEDVAWELGLSRATLYRLIARYRAARTVEALIEKPLGRPKGSLREDPVRDTLIRQFLEREYLQPTRLSRCQKRGEKCSFARLLPFSVGIFPGRASQYCCKICEYPRVTRRWFCPLHAVYGRTASPAPQQVTDRLPTVASFHPSGVVFGDIYRHRRLTSRQRAPLDFSY